MSTAFRYESSVAQFQENPFTRDWPESTAIDALFRYCVERFLSNCRSDPLSWLTENDLQVMLCQLLRDELPSHGLPECAVHVGYSHCILNKPEQPSKQLRGASTLDLVLVAPQSIHWTSEARWEAQLAAVASIKRGHAHLREIREDLQKLTAIKETNPGVLSYLIVMGYQDQPNQIEAVEHTAQELGITYLGDNYTRLIEPVRQEKLL